MTAPRRISAHDMLGDWLFLPAAVTFADAASGPTIEFEPVGFFLKKPHPIVAELRAAVATARPA